MAVGVRHFSEACDTVIVIQNKIIKYEDLLEMDFLPWGKEDIEA